MKTKIFLLILISVIAAEIVKAQNPISSVVASYQYVNLVPVQIAGMSSEQLQLENKNFNVIATLQSTTGVSKIAVMMGSGNGSNDLFYKEFILNEEGTSDDGTFYSSNGNNLNFGIGQYSGPPRYYVEVFAIMEDGSFSESVRTEL